MSDYLHGTKTDILKHDIHLVWYLFGACDFPFVTLKQFVWISAHCMLGISVIPEYGYCKGFHKSFFKETVIVAHQATTLSWFYITNCYEMGNGFFTIPSTQWQTIFQSITSCLWYISYHIISYIISMYMYIYTCIYRERYKRGRGGGETERQETWRQRRKIHDSLLVNWALSFCKAAAVPA